MQLSKIFLLAALILAGCKTTDDSDPETRPGGWSPLDSKTIAEAAKGKVDFSSHVEPILEAKCTACHSGSQPAAGLNLTHKDSAFADGPKGPRIVPGNPKASVFVQNISATHDSVSVMPRVGNSITKEETAILKRWIEQGANWP